MDETIKGPNQAGSKPASQPATPVLTHWKPVTDIYQQHAAAPPLAQVIEIPRQAVVEAKKASKPLSNVPRSIYVFAAIYFLQGLVFFFLAAIIIAASNSAFSNWIVMQSPAIIPFAIGNGLPREFATLIAEALIVMGVFSIVITVMWIVRFWWIRWVAMCYAGGMVARECIYYFAGVASGVGGGYTSVTGAALGMGTGYTPEQRFILTIECAMNLLIFCYLAFYPGVKLAFEKHY